jgi:hypothetical protein
MATKVTVLGGWTIAVAAVLLLATIFAKTYVVSDITYKEILVGTVVSLALVVFLNGRRGIDFGLVCAIWTMALGYRTIAATPSLTFHPAELMLWALLVYMLVERTLVGEHFGPGWLPWWMYVMMSFCLWGWVVDPPPGITWDMQFMQFKVFLILIPLFSLVSALLRTTDMWNRVILSIFLAGVWVAGLGALEFFVPATGGYFKGLMVETAPSLGEEGFLRAPFSFWGSPDAVYVCMVATPLIPAVWAMASKKSSRLLILLGVVVLLIGVYISGHRSAWLLILLVACFWVFLRKGVLWGSTAIVIGGFFLGLAANLLPPEAAERFQSGLLVVQGKSSDTSGKKRWARAEESYQNIQKFPLGRGWATAGWVHNDFLMITENLGIPGGLFFAAAYLITLIRLLRTARARAPSPLHKEISISLLLSLFVAGWLLAFDATLVLTQLALPVWTAWVLGETWVHQNSTYLVPSHG